MTRCHPNNCIIGRYYCSYVKTESSKNIYIFKCVKVRNLSSGLKEVMASGGDELVFLASARLNDTVMIYRPPKNLNMFPNTSFYGIKSLVFYELTSEEYLLNCVADKL